MSDIYEQFLEDWFTHAKERLQESINLTEINKKVTDLKKCFYNYAQAFAYTLFAEDKVEITYTPIDSEDEFEIQEYTGHKAFEHFFKSSDANPASQKLLDAKRSACPLRRNIKDVYSFMHKSFQDYFAANYLFILIYDRYRNIKEQQNKDKNVFKDILNNLTHANHKKLIYVLDALNKQYLTEERLILRFLAEILEKLPFEEKEALSEEFLLPMIQYSAKNKNYAKAASSIISILNATKVTMSGWDLRRVSIPKADLSRGYFTSNQFY